LKDDGFNVKDEDEEERFVDVKTESTDDERDAEDEDEEPKQKNGKRKKGDKNSKTSWVHKNLVIHKSHDSYDYTQRNPLYSGADKTLTFELLHFARHFHPTVALFANKLIHVIGFFLEIFELS
jgi:ribosome biogenesis protein MAK21